MTQMTILIIVAAFVGAAALVVALSQLLNQRHGNRLESRLEALTHQVKRDSESKERTPTVLAEPIEDKTSLTTQLLKYFPNLERLLEQADVGLAPGRLVAIATVLVGVGLAIGVVLKLHPALIAILPPALGSIPFLWILWRRRCRLKAFAAQLPEALDMLARALRSGQSLASGFNLVAKEIPAPVGKEFGRVFEEQNLGIPLEESLRDMAERIPNLDLKFFATAVILQRQTGGDLAEILDRISSLIRERFTIWGQVQALTGEGRLSGIILMALPVVLFLAIYRLNPDYVMTLFTDPLGQKMLAVAIVMQILGAIVIRKIVTIKV
ncbi:MAG: type II secretion system F family protein [Thermogutta sp.]|nr:type II secretion system F family protein [Thermogutta sp.]